MANYSEIYPGQFAKKKKRETGAWESEDRKKDSKESLTVKAEANRAGGQGLKGNQG